MDNLRPELVWIEGRCYRFNDSSCWSKERGTAAYESESYQPDYSCADADSCDAEIEIVSTEGRKFTHSFHVAKQFFPFIIGAKGSTRKKLEGETKTTIRIPKQGYDGDIVITGSDRKGVAAARRRIDLLLISSRKKLSFTHFISIPMNVDSVMNGFNSFKDDILKGDLRNANGVEESIFQNPKKLHLTLGLMVLLDDDEQQQAVEALENCKKHVIQPILRENGPMRIQLRGVEYMNDDPTAVNVLFAKAVTDNDILQRLADGIVEYFVKIGLMENQFEKVKIHMTVMNTKFRNSAEQSNTKSRKTFDATGILKAHRNTEFGEMLLNSIHLSQRDALDDDGFYQATSKIDLSDCY